MANLYKYSKFNMLSNSCLVVTFPFMSARCPLDGRKQEGEMRYVVGGYVPCVCLDVYITCYTQFNPDKRGL